MPQTLQSAPPGAAAVARSSPDVRVTASHAGGPRGVVIEGPPPWDAPGVRPVEFWWTYGWPAGDEDKAQQIVPEVRRAVVAKLESWDLHSTIQRMEQLVSELVGNGVTHGMGNAVVPGACPRLEVMLTRRATSLLLQVRDGSADLPTTDQHDDLGEHGRGLVLVRAFADAVGYCRRADGKTVWCLINLPAAAEGVTE